VDISGNVYVKQGARLGNDTSGNWSEIEKGKIRKITPAGWVTTLAEMDNFDNPFGGLVVDASGNVYAADYDSISKITPSGTVTRNVFSDALPIDSRIGFRLPIGGISIDTSGNLYVSTSQESFGLQLIRKITPAGQATTLVSNANFIDLGPITVDASGNIYGIERGSYYWNGRDRVQDLDSLRKITPAGGVTSQAKVFGALNSGTGISIAADTLGNVYVPIFSGNKIIKISPAGVITNLAGSGQEGNTNGTGTSASFRNPNAVAVDSSGNVYVADLGNNLIRKISPTGLVTTLAGNGEYGIENGAGTAASFSGPFALTVDTSGNVYVAQGGNWVIRKITPAGLVTTVVGNGEMGGKTNGKAYEVSVKMDDNFFMATDPLGNLYFGNTGAIQKVTFVKP